MVNYYNCLIIWLAMSVIFCLIALADYYVEKNPNAPISKFINRMVSDEDEGNKKDKES